MHVPAELKRTERLLGHMQPRMHAELMHMNCFLGLMQAHMRAQEELVHMKPELLRTCTCGGHAHGA